MIHQQLAAAIEEAREIRIAAVQQPLSAFTARSTSSGTLMVW